MIHRCEQLYQELLNDLRYCRNKGLSFLVETECCFYLAEKYRGLLREELATHAFQSVAEEIHFFKNINPKFIAESEYASLLNYAGNFSPSIDVVAEIRNFWLRQVNRLEKFKHIHKDFYIYYIEGHTHLDTVFYTHAMHPPGKTDKRYDLLTGQLLARERYALYAGQQLEALQATQENEP